VFTATQWAKLASPENVETTPLDVAGEDGMVFDDGVTFLAMAEKSFLNDDNDRRCGACFRVVGKFIINRMAKWSGIFHLGTDHWSTIDDFRPEQPQVVLEKLNRP